MRINVTQTYLPPFEEYRNYLMRAWDKKWITNRGELVLELEERLKSFLDVPYLTATNNGTIPLQLAIKGMALTGEIITTPFSYVATTSAILWEHCEPVFVDIHPEYLSIDERQIEAAITPKTTGILATHVFGNPCHVEEIERIANRHGLKVIYDAAHCFGVKFNGKSLFTYGDVSTCSFHATKIFHTGEGGCIITKDQALHEKLYLHHNFGHQGPDKFSGLGINAKMSELNAAMGLAVLDHITDLITARKQVVEAYDDLLDPERVKGMRLREGTEWNYHYYPVIFPSEEKLLESVGRLHAEEIYPRRYFYPSLNLLDYVQQGSRCPVGESVSDRVLCLPLYPGLSRQDVERIAKIINS